MNTRTFITRLFLLGALAIVALDACAADRPGWWETTDALKIGDLEAVVRTNMSRFKEENWRSFTNEYSRRLACLRGYSASIWLVYASTLDTEGGETYVIALFSPTGELSDLLHFRAALHLRPLVRGVYSQRLKSIKKGMTVDDLYRLLGEDLPERYFRDKSGKWVVRFSYQGDGPDFWIYEADAASGEITQVAVSLI